MFPICATGHAHAPPSCAETCFQALGNRFLTQGELLLLDTQERGFLWPDLTFWGVYWVMPNWTSYAYCAQCDRPFRENECRSESIGSGNTWRTIYFCRVCESLARDFNKIIILPKNLFIALILCIGFTVMYFQGVVPSIIRGPFFRRRPSRSSLVMYPCFWRKSAFSRCLTYSVVI